MSSNENLKPRFWYGYYVCACLLIAKFLWSVLTPGVTYEMPRGVYLSIGIDLGLLVAVVLARRQILRWGDPGTPKTTRAKLVFFPAVISGVGLILIRFLSDKGWWTGHLT